MTPTERLTEYVNAMTAGNRDDVIHIVATSAYRGGQDFELRLSDLRTALEELKARRLFAVTVMSPDR